jgi:Uma2 family endonuclease
MPITLTEPPPRTLESEPLRKRWTRDECETLAKAGLVDVERYELIEGELIQKVRKSFPQMRARTFLMNRLNEVFGFDFVVPAGATDVAPADNPTSDPEPDAIVLARSILEMSARPRPEDIRLVVEVSDTTLAFDLNVKAGLYARAGIPEYWVLDVRGRRLVVHRDPIDGKYRSVVAYSEDESCSCLAAPDRLVRVGDLL